MPYADWVISRTQFLEQLQADKNYEFDDYDVQNAVAPSPRKLTPATGNYKQPEGRRYPVHHGEVTSLDLPKGYYEERIKMNKQQGR